MAADPAAISEDENWACGREWVAGVLVAKTPILNLIRPTSMHL
jgi:hypothetical protein